MKRSLMELKVLLQIEFKMYLNIIIYIYSFKKI